MQCWWRRGGSLAKACVRSTKNARRRVRRGWRRQRWGRRRRDCMVVECVRTRHCARDHGSVRDRDPNRERSGSADEAVPAAPRDPAAGATARRTTTAADGMGVVATTPGALAGVVRESAACTCDRDVRCRLGGIHSYGARSQNFRCRRPRWVMGRRK